MTPRRAALTFLLLAIVHTWPLGAMPWRLSLGYHADAQLNGWILSWYPHALVTAPAHFFDGNIFAPERGTLAYSEPLVLQALAGAPLIWIGVHPAVVLNLLTILGLALTGWSGWFVARRWTGSESAALVGGALVAFNVHLLTRIPHLTAVHAWGLPLTLYFTDALVDRPDRRRVLFLALTIAGVAATSVYWLALSGVLVIVVIACGARSIRALGAAAAAGALGLLIASPVLLPYVRLASTGAVRSIENAREFSATLAGYATSTSWLHQAWSPAVTNDVNVFFAGVLAIALAALGIARGLASRGVDRRRAITLIVIAGCGILLSLGPATGIYRWSYDWFPPLRGLRAASRFGLLYLVALAMAAAMGAAWIERRRAMRPALLAAILVAGVSVEAWQGPLRTSPLPARPRIYTLLAREPGPVMLVEVPFYPAGAAFENGEYVFNSTLHFRPLMNGYSGFTPMSYRRRAESFWFFPEPFAIEAIKREGATHVMVHLPRFGRDAADVERALRGRNDLELVAADPDGRRLYRVR